jgi:hypothetical protein
VSYSLDAKTSVHAGFGMFYTAIEGLSAGIMSANPPYGYDYDSLTPPLFATPFITAASGQDVGQRFPEPIPASGASVAKPNSTVDWSQYLPINGVPAFFQQNVTPDSASYTLSIERAPWRRTPRFAPVMSARRRITCWSWFRRIRGIRRCVSV